MKDGDCGGGSSKATRWQQSRHAAAQLYTAACADGVRQEHRTAKGLCASLCSNQVYANRACPPSKHPPLTCCPCWPMLSASALVMSASCCTTSTGRPASRCCSCATNGPCSNACEGVSTSKTEHIHTHKGGHSSAGAQARKPMQPMRLACTRHVC